MASRDPWASAFEQIGVNRVAMRDLSEEEFCQQCAFITEAGLGPGLPVPTPVVRPTFRSSAPRPPPSFPVRESSGVIREKQNEEFARAQFAEKQRQKEDDERRAKEERERQEKLQRKEQDRRRIREEIRGKAAALPPEKADGIVIAVTLPSRERIQRKFGLDQRAEDIFAFVADQEQLFDEAGNPKEFELSQGTDDVVREKTLAEQGITRRTLLRVVIIE
jgi:hypothetical protein